MCATEIGEEGGKVKADRFLLKRERKVTQRMDLSEIINDYRNTRGSVRDILAYHPYCILREDYYLK